MSEFFKQTIPMLKLTPPTCVSDFVDGEITFKPGLRGDGSDVLMTFKDCNGEEITAQVPCVLFDLAGTIFEFETQIKEELIKESVQVTRINNPGATLDFSDGEIVFDPGVEDTDYFALVSLKDCDGEVITAKIPDGLFDSVINDLELEAPDKEFNTYYYKYLYRQTFETTMDIMEINGHPTTEQTMDFKFEPNPEDFKFVKMTITDTDGNATKVKLPLDVVDTLVQMFMGLPDEED